MYIPLKIADLENSATNSQAHTTEQQATANDLLAAAAEISGLPKIDLLGLQKSAAHSAVNEEKHSNETVPEMIGYDENTSSAAESIEHDENASGASNVVDCEEKSSRPSDLLDYEKKFAAHEHSTDNEEDSNETTAEMIEFDENASSVGDRFDEEKTAGDKIDGEVPTSSPTDALDFEEETSSTGDMLDYELVQAAKELVNEQEEEENEEDHKPEDAKESVSAYSIDEDFSNDDFNPDYLDPTTDLEDFLMFDSVDIQEATDYLAKIGLSE